jgi:hypothetical protein
MKKRLKLKSWVKWLIVGLVLLGIVELFLIIDNKFVDNCTKAGYTKEYCIAHK